MPINIFRTVLIIHIAAFVLGVFGVFSPVTNWPDHALIYADWYQSQPTSQTDYIINRIAIASLIVMLLSAFFMLFFFSLARYFYIASILVATLTMLPVLYTKFDPVLLGGYTTFLNQVTAITAGIIMTLIFTEPLASRFRGIQHNT
jgi:hypothetical protein